MKQWFFPIAALVLLIAITFSSCRVNDNKMAAVDLGLSVKWANYNIGAEKPEDYGDYYAWGETDPKSDYSKSSYKWFEEHDMLTKYNTNRSQSVLDPEDDVAHVKLGGKWRMPTKAEWTELLTKCSWERTTQNGVTGMLVTAKNGNSIFLPAAGGWFDTSPHGEGDFGRYWSSSLDKDDPNYAWNVGFYSGDIEKSSFLRCYGISIRPVSE